MPTISELALVVTAKDSASKVLDDVGKSAGGLGKHLGDVAKIAGGFIIGGGIQKLGGFLVDAAKGAADDAASQGRLQQAIENTGVAWGDYEDQIGKVITAGQKRGFTDDQSRDSLAILAAQTGSTTEATKRYSLAQDLARGANIDVVTASKLLGKVTEENVNVLARYGIKVKEGAGETELFGAIQEKFGGQADKFASTTAGKMAILSDKLGELKETIGGAVLPVMTLLANVALGLVPIIEKLAALVGPILGGAFKAVSDLVTPFAKYLRFTADEGDYLNDHLSNIPKPLQAIALEMGKLVAFVRDSVIPEFNNFIGTLTSGKISDEIPTTFETVALRIRGAWETTIRPALVGLVGYITDTVLPTFGKIAGVIIDTVIPAFVTGASEIAKNKEIAAIAIVALGAAIVLALGPVSLAATAIVGIPLLVSKIAPGFEDEALLLAIAAVGIAIFVALGPVSQAAVALAGIVTAIGLIKENWQDLRNFISSTPIQAEVKIAGTNVSGAEGGLLDKILDKFLPLRAAGGPVSAGQPYIVGEKGPELFVPGASGVIVPNRSSNMAMAGGGFVGGIIDRAKDALGENSPSKVFMQIGQDVVEGLTRGIEQRAPDSWNAASMLAKGVSQATITALQSGETTVKAQIGALYSDITSGRIAFFADEGAETMRELVALTNNVNAEILDNEERIRSANQRLLAAAPGINEYIQGGISANGTIYAGGRGSFQGDASGEMLSALENARRMGYTLPAGFAQGTNYVPRTGLAILHKGEAVVPASQNRGGVTIVINIGTVYGMPDFKQKVAEAVRDVKLAGGFYGVLA